MAEPATSAATAAIVTTTVGVAAVVTQLDPGAVIGAFAGSVTFAMTAKDTAIWARVAYMMVSLVVGYAAVPDVAALAPVKSPLVIAYAVSALAVHTTLVAIDRLKQLDVATLWRDLLSIFRKQ
ncbi:putative holin [Bordetella bronchiseptica]|uniref:putative holin n=1 Tax=Bordetella bronchiseptica TaxID=518 RepID=UPI0005288677|nr:putative holin [Bordetella bronchiseptica]